MPTPVPEFQRYQNSFTAHIRDPKEQARPHGIEARRMKVYNELVYNSIEGALANCFPVLKKVLGKRRWVQLMRAFLAKHRWPVHLIAPRRRVVPQDTFLLVFRNKDDQIQFIEINAFTARLLNLLETTNYTGQTALEMIAQESRHSVPEVVIEGGLAVMQDLHLRGGLLGVMREEHSL